MTAFERITTPQNRIILLPAEFTWFDEKTLLTHQGAMLVRPEPESDRGRVIGYTKLCTDVLVVDWKTQPSTDLHIVSCLNCLGACPQ